MIDEAFANLPRAIVVQSLSSRCCPCCGLNKSVGMSLRRECFMRLPPSYRRSLYSRIDFGYTPALANALQWLLEHTPGRETAMHLPDGWNRVTAGAYLHDGESRLLKVEVDELLAHHRLENTPENRDGALATISKMVAMGAIPCGRAYYTLEDDPTEHPLPEAVL
jgi:hypothetical protein